MKRFRAAFLNIQAHLPHRKVAADTRRSVKARPDAIGYSEIGGRTKVAVMRAVLLRYGYRLVRLKGPASAVPAAYRLRGWRLVQAFAFPLSPATDVGQAGAGPSTLREKEATVLGLRKRRRPSRRHLPRRRAFFIVCHLAPSLRFEARSQLHDLQVERLAVLVQQLRAEHPAAEIHLVGDFNTSDRRRLQPLIDAGLNLAADVPTHGRRAIDRCFSTFPAAHPRAVGGFHTDHDELVVGLVQEDS